MRKSSVKNHDKHLSIILVPHSTNEVKVFRISSVRYKLYTMFTVLITIILCSGLFVGYVMYQNNHLKNEIAAVYNTNTQQIQMLDEKSAVISAWIARDGENKRLINEFNNMVKEITNSYIDNRMSSTTANRSGGHTDSSFVNDMRRLQNTLEKLKEINNADQSMLDGLTETETKLQAYIDSVPTLWPASGRLSSDFGGRRDPLNFANKFHEGIDIAASHGDNILAAASGKVIHSGSNGNYGYCVIINHGNGITTLYAHASKLLVKEGQIVEKGDLIAKVGSTGRSTGDHLHFEVRVKGVPVDPIEYLDKD